MKIGVNVPNFGPGATPAILTEWGRRAEQLGFHLLMISDHVAVTPDVAQLYPAPFYDPFVTLSWLAAQTTHIELGTTVAILPYRHPLLLARMAANLDQLSGGRFKLGIGVGWAEQEFTALGLSFSDRGLVSDDYLRAILAAWSADIATYHGEFISYEEVQTGPRPVRGSVIPVWIGGNGTAARRRAVRFNLPWHPIYFQMRWLVDQALPDLRSIAATDNRPTPPLCPRIRLNLTDSPLEDDDRRAGEGTLEQVQADLAFLEDLGADYVLLDTYRGIPEETAFPEDAWLMLEIVASNVLT